MAQRCIGVPLDSPSSLLRPAHTSQRVGVPLDSPLPLFCPPDRMLTEREAVMPPFSAIW